MSVPYFPDSLGQSPAWKWGAAQGFCRFPGLDSTEAELLSGDSRLPLLLGPSIGVSRRSTGRQKATRNNHFPRTVELRASCRRGSQSSSLNSAPSWRRRLSRCWHLSTSSLLNLPRNVVGFFNHSVCALRSSHNSVVISCIRSRFIAAGCTFLRTKSVQF
jgi:hypothetical protein